ncbi:MAG: 5-formyltetrahydrofolate cyclo-ligase, partial [Deltaproteobacteria bacterium]|nr:5-formyltetrahydrofolate cyclo-ligase [Deltaproteobacteria bacterium]
IREKGSFVALAFELQMVGEVPVDRDHDEPVDIIVTEERVIRCKG